MALPGQAQHAAGRTLPASPVRAPDSGAMTSASAQRRSSMCTTGSPTWRHCRHSSSSPAHARTPGVRWIRHTSTAGSELLSAALELTHTCSEGQCSTAGSRPPGAGLARHAAAAAASRQLPTALNHAPSTGWQAGGRSLSSKKYLALLVASTLTSANCAAGKGEGEASAWAAGPSSSLAGSMAVVLVGRERSRTPLQDAATSDSAAGRSTHL